LSLERKGDAAAGLRTALAKRLARLWVMVKRLSKSST
jgi:hypothetical protein